MDNSSAALTLSVVGLVPAIFGTCCRPLAVVYSDAPDAPTVAGIRDATLLSATAVLGVATLTREPRVLIAGGLAVAVYASMYVRAART